MEMLIKDENLAAAVGEMGKKVLIATLYSAEPVILATTRLGPDRLILLVDNEPDKEQEKSLKLICVNCSRLLRSCYVAKLILFLKAT